MIDELCRVLRTMLTVSPYNKWPLRVKLYSKEAARFWEQVNATAPPLPQGYSETTEYEGVDGKTGCKGSERTGPIDVTDSTSGCPFLLSLA